MLILYFLSCLIKYSYLLLMPGLSNGITISNLPGCKRAGSNFSGLFVIPTTITSLLFFVSVAPLIQFKKSDNNLEGFCKHSKSISSMHKMQGDLSSAIDIISPKQSVEK